MEFIKQTDRLCVVAIIRMIRQECEKCIFSDEDVLKDCKPEAKKNGLDVVDIENYWLKFKEIYKYEKGENQSLAQIQAKAKEGYMTMIIIHSAGQIFHCVFFEDFTGNSVSYWDPTGKHFSAAFADNFRTFRGLR